MCLEIYQPTERGKWELTTYTDGELVEFKSVNLSVSIDQIYEDIIFASEELPSS
jgi:Uma2 family endonuclease